MSNKSEKTMIESIMANYTSVNDTYTREQVLSITNDLEAAISSVEHSGNGIAWKVKWRLLKPTDFETATAFYHACWQHAAKELDVLYEENERLKEEMEETNITYDQSVKDIEALLRPAITLFKQRAEKAEAELSSLKEQGDGLLTEIREVLESFVSTKTQPVNDYEARIYVNVVREETYKLLVKFPQPPKY